MNMYRKFLSCLLILMLSGFPMPDWAEDVPDAWEKVVFHVDDSANARWAMMLAGGYLQDSPGVKIIFVTYGPGINFLLEDATDRRGNPYDPDVISLVAKGVEFRVCNGTLEARDISPEDVLDVAKIVPSGLVELTRLQLKEGYAYIKP